MPGTGSIPQRRLLITGASGFLGWHLCRQSVSDWRVFGTYRRHPTAVAGVRLLRVDLTRYGDLKTLFETVRPDAVIHAAAAAKPDFCQNHPRTSQRINTEAAVALAGLCADHRIPCVFTSSDLVFDGSDPPYTETDPVSPINTNGEQKVLAETGMKARYPDTVICRMALMFGQAGPIAESFLQPLMRALRSGKAVCLFTDEFRSLLGAEDAARGLLTALETRPEILHLGGPERMSRFRFGILLEERFTISEANVIACRQQDLVLPALRPTDVSLDIAAARGLGFHPEPPARVLEKLRSGDLLDG